MSSRKKQKYNRSSSSNSDRKRSEDNDSSSSRGREKDIKKNNKNNKREEYKRDGKGKRGTNKNQKKNEKERYSDSGSPSRSKSSSQLDSQSRSSSRSSGGNDQRRRNRGGNKSYSSSRSRRSDSRKRSFSNSNSRDSGSRRRGSSNSNSRGKGSLSNDSQDNGSYYCVDEKDNDSSEVSSENEEKSSEISESSEIGSQDNEMDNYNPKLEDYKIVEFKGTEFDDFDKTSDIKFNDNSKVCLTKDYLNSKLCNHKYQSFIQIDMNKYLSSIGNLDKSNSANNFQIGLHKSLKKQKRKELGEFYKNLDQESSTTFDINSEYLPAFRREIEMNYSLYQGRKYFPNVENFSVISKEDQTRKERIKIKYVSEEGKNEGLELEKNVIKKYRLDKPIDSDITQSITEEIKEEPEVEFNFTVNKKYQEIANYFETNFENENRIKDKKLAKKIKSFKVENIHGRIVVFYKLKKSDSEACEEIEREWQHYYKYLLKETIKINAEHDEEESKIDIIKLASFIKKLQKNKKKSKSAKNKINEKIVELKNNIRSLNENKVEVFGDKTKVTKLTLKDNFQIPLVWMHFGKNKKLEGLMLKPLIDYSEEESKNIIWIYKYYEDKRWEILNDFENSKDAKEFEKLFLSYIKETTMSKKKQHLKAIENIVFKGIKIFQSKLKQDDDIKILAESISSIQNLDRGMIVIGNDKDDKFCLTRISPCEVIISEKSKAVVKEMIELSNQSVKYNKNKVKDEMLYYLADQNLFDKNKIDFMYKYGCFAEKTEEYVEITGILPESIEEFLLSDKKKIKKFKASKLEIFKGTGWSNPEKILESEETTLFQKIKDDDLIYQFKQELKNAAEVEDHETPEYKIKEIYTRINYGNWRNFKDEELRQTQELGKSKDKSSSLTKQVFLIDVCSECGNQKNKNEEEKNIKLFNHSNADLDRFSTDLMIKNKYVSPVNWQGIVFKTYQRTTYFTTNPKLALLYSCPHTYRKIVEFQDDPEEYTVLTVVKLAKGLCVDLKISKDGDVDNYERKSSSIQVIDDQNNVETVNADSLMFDKYGCKVYSVYSISKYYEFYNIILKIKE